MSVNDINSWFLLLLCLLTASFFHAQTSLAPWLPTRRKDLERISRLAGLDKGQKFYEVGCGTAAVSTFLAKRNPEAEVMGIELAFPIYLLARARRLLCGAKNLKIEYGNALHKDYADADAVYIFGLPETVSGKLREKLERELRPGARFISYVFEVKGWQGSASFVDKPTMRDNGINVYVK